MAAALARRPRAGGDAAPRKQLAGLGLLPKAVIVACACRFFQERNIDVKVEYSWGATEVGGVASVGRRRSFWAGKHKAAVLCRLVAAACSPWLLAPLLLAVGEAAGRLTPRLTVCPPPQVKASLPGVGGIVDITEVSWASVHVACGSGMRPAACGHVGQGPRIACDSFVRLYKRSCHIPLALPLQMSPSQTGSSLKANKLRVRVWMGKARCWWRHVCC